MYCIYILCEILQCLKKTTALYLDRLDDYKIKRTNIEELKLWARTLNMWARNQIYMSELFLKQI